VAAGRRQQLEEIINYTAYLKSGASARWRHPDLPS
jgi:hypothetical protein